MFSRAKEMNLTLWGQNHNHVSPFQPGSLLDHHKILDPLSEAVEHFFPEFWMSDFSATEEDGNFDLVPFLQKAFNVTKLELEVVVLRAGSYFNFLDMDDGLVFPRLLDPFALLVFVLPIIHDPADRRLGIRSHLHKV